MELHIEDLDGQFGQLTGGWMEDPQPPEASRCWTVGTFLPACSWSRGVVEIQHHAKKAGHIRKSALAKGEEK